MIIQRLVLDKVACFDHLDLEFHSGRDPKKADVHVLVGPNGSGKSTILMALAQFFSMEPLGFEKRLRGKEAMALLQTDGTCRDAITLYTSQHSENLKWEGEPLSSAGRSGDLLFYRSSDSEKVGKIRALSSQYNPFQPQHSDTRFSFAAFAYSGQRSVASYGLQAITEQRDNPLQNACQFSNTGSPQQLVQWIANTKAKEAFALAKKDHSKAKRNRDSITRIEHVIGQITGKSFEFVMDDEPLKVSALIEGETVELDVLPDGLKSIISWVADLLMRMDRVPWEDDTPVLNRPFVLFLDEIEVHLHPKWQRKVLPTVQSLFPNAHVFISTHSPFIIASAEDAWIYPLHVEGNLSRAGAPLSSLVGNSYATVLRDVLGIEAEFAPQVEKELADFYELRDKALQGNGTALEELRSKAESLRSYGEEVLAIVIPEIRQVERRLKQPKDSGTV